MARPRRYGPAVSLRLPLEDHDRMLAAAADRPVGAWLRDVVLDRIGRREPATVAAASSSPPSGIPDTARRAAGEEAQDRADEIALAKCKHPKTTFNGTIKICDTCKKRVP